MSAWGTRRQLSFVLVFILLLSFAAVLLIIINRHAPACNDDVQNQGELGIDCSGPCTKVCAVEINDLAALWTRIFKVREGIYDVAAYVENPNDFGLVNLPYHIRIYDAENVPVKDVEGEVFLNPHERALIFEPQVNVGFRIPNRAFITFPDKPVWHRLNPARATTLTVTNQRIETSPILSLRATLTNDSLFLVSAIELDALLYGQSGNVLHVSRTYVENLASGQSKEISFTWPTLPTETVVSSDILPRVDLVSSNVIHADTLP